MDENKKQESENVPNATQTPLRPTAIVNGQPFTPITPIVSVTDNNFETPDKKHSRLRFFFIIIGVFQILGVALFLAVMFGAAQQAKQGVSGTEFIALALYITLVPGVALLAVINLISLPIYMIKNKVRGKFLIFSIISLVISTTLFILGSLMVYNLYSYPKQLNEQLDKKYKEKQQAFAADNAKPEITKEEAIDLLKTCKLKGFYYTNQTDKSDPANGGWGELSTTGVVLTKVDGKPYRISIADRLIPELVPIAREAQKTCGDPQFWHDGNYESYKDGKWYFNKDVVNDVNSEKTEEEAIALLKDCKIDYFVGYTDINLIKDDSTKSWLVSAEKSSTGIDISDSGSPTYVFASKAKTIELQDDARKYRDACYEKKKLYITIDKWIETEYPMGQWAKVEI